MNRPMTGGSRLSLIDAGMSSTFINIPPIQHTVATRCSQSTIVADIINPVLPMVHLLVDIV
jgi:hypothetical protein